MSEDKVCHNVERLRDPERLALLGIDRVVALCLQDLEIGTVLDIGTGSGVFAEAFARLGYEVTGIDFQETMLEAAGKHVPGAHFEVASAEDLPFADRSFGLCFMGLFLHEADRPLQALQEAHRVCVRRTSILEWPYAEQDIGPPLKHRLETETVLRLATASGFSGARTVPLDHHVLFLLEK